LRRRAQTLLAGRGVRDAGTWTGAVLAALCRNGLRMSPENLALVFALIERESSFDPHGLLPNPPGAFRKLAYRAIDDLLAADSSDFESLLGRTAAARLVDHALRALRGLSLLDRDRLRRSFDRYDLRLGWSRRVRTERDVETVVAPDLLTIAEEMSPIGLTLRATFAWEPRWRALVAEGRLFRSVGPLQTEPAAAVALAAQNGLSLDAAGARALLYTIDGGVHFGVRQLAPLIQAYARDGRLDEAGAGFVAADWRQGYLFACRDAALVAQIARSSGGPLPPQTRLSDPAVRDRLLALGPAFDGRAAPDAEAAAAHAQAVRVLQGAAADAVLDRLEPVLRLRAAYRARFREAPAVALVPDLRFNSAKTGRYRLRDVVAETERRFASNCRALGCGS
jgi:hypothetical protein